VARIIQRVSFIATANTGTLSDIKPATAGIFRESLGAQGGDRIYGLQLCIQNSVRRVQPSRVYIKIQDVSFIVNLSTVAVAVYHGGCRLSIR
jgi:hypothetical protein